MNKASAQGKGGQVTTWHQARHLGGCIIEGLASSSCLGDWDVQASVYQGAQAAACDNLARDLHDDKQGLRHETKGNKTINNLQKGGKKDYIYQGLCTPFVYITLCWKAS